jgi:hypothetical protein
VLVFSELRGGTSGVYALVIGGSLIMAIGAVLIASSSVSGDEHASWRRAAAREAERYGVDQRFTEARVAGEETSAAPLRRSWLDWVIVAAASAVLLAFAAIAEAPRLDANWSWMVVLVVALALILAISARALWRTTRFT